MIFHLKISGLLKSHGVRESYIASYVNSASWVLVLEGGVISHQGTPDEIRGSGYDLSTHIISFVSPKASTPSRGKEVAVTNTPEKELSAETTDFGSQGFVPYWFYFRAGGWHRVIIAMVRVGGSLASYSSDNSLRPFCSFGVHWCLPAKCVDLFILKILGLIILFDVTGVS